MGVQDGTEDVEVQFFGEKYSGYVVERYWPFHSAKSEMVCRLIS